MSFLFNVRLAITHFVLPILSVVTPLLWVGGGNFSVSGLKAPGFESWDGYLVTANGTTYFLISHAATITIPPLSPVLQSLK